MIHDRNGASLNELLTQTCSMLLWRLSFFVPGIVASRYISQHWRNFSTFVLHSIRASMLIHIFVVSQKREKNGKAQDSVASESISAAGKQNMCMFSCVFWDFTRFSDIKRSNEWVHGSFYLHNRKLAGLERAALSLRKERSLIFVEKATARVFPPDRWPAVVAGAYRPFDPW